MSLRDRSSAAGPTISEAIRPTDEFAADERLLRTGRPAVRVSVLSERALSIGIAVPEAADFVARARAAGLPVVRRSSGGTGVLHEPGDLAWSVVVPRTHPVAGRGFVRAYGRIGAGVVRALARYGVAARWTSAPALDADCCVLSGRGEVLEVERRLLGGAAQHLTGGALLHQGMLAAAVDRPAHELVFGLDRRTLDRLVGWAELGARVDSRPLAATVGAELAADLLPPP